MNEIITFFIGLIIFFIFYRWFFKTDAYKKIEKKNIEYQSAEGQKFRIAFILILFFPLLILILILYLLSGFMDIEYITRGEGPGAGGIIGIVLAYILRKK